jgi:GDP-mannose 6-dehydrogenase
MVDSPETIVASSDVIVVGNKSPEFKTILPELRHEQIVIDLVRIADPALMSNMQYQGICW